MVLGNSILIKQAESTPRSAVIIEELFREAGFGKGEFTNLFVSHAQCEQLIADRRVRAVKFTGSSDAGKKVAALCGTHMKKGCFELGGNDPFVVLKEANIDLAVEKAYVSRMAANG